MQKSTFLLTVLTTTCLCVVTPLACKKGPAGAIVALDLGGFEGTVAPVEMKIAGGTPDPMGLRLAALPAPGTPVELSVTDLCGGRKSITVPFPPVTELQASTPSSGPYAGVTIAKLHVKSVEGLDLRPTVLLVDPALPAGTELSIGGKKVASGQNLWNLACASAMTVGGKTVPIPHAEQPIGAWSGLFVTDRPEVCFADEVVGYGKLAGGVTVLSGSRVYGVRKGRYDFFFAPIDANTRARTTEGTTRSALHEMPCPPH